MCPVKGLVYPKTDEKPPFQTRDEIERQIARGGLTEAQQDELWDCALPPADEIDELLGTSSEARAAYPWIYPMLCMAAHTGARRAELIRVAGRRRRLRRRQVVTIREKKRVRGQADDPARAAHAVPGRGPDEWLAVHPGGNHLFCHVGRGRAEQEAEPHHRPSEREGPGDDAQGPAGRPSRIAKHPGFGPDQGRSRRPSHADARRLEWEVVRGWHVLRHSFISICAQGSRPAADRGVGRPHDRGDEPPISPPDPVDRGPGDRSVFS